MNGLLRSLLHDLYTQGPQLIQHSASWRWRATWFGATSLPEWSHTELFNTFRSLTEAVAISNSCMFLLVDGLDEFDGSEAERDELIELLKAVGAFPCVKLCTSSRPWTAFESAFESGPNLRLEKLTQGDISLYVNKKFQKLRAFQDLTLLHSVGCQALTQNIVIKAQGVFLWVYLVVASLSRGMEDGLGMAQLHEKLEEMPGDLETYFRQIILAVPERYRPVAASYFALMMNVHRSISPLTLSSFFIEGPDLAQSYCQPAILEAAKRVTARRLESHCGGLLQISERPQCGIYRHEYVDLLHRTVRDFLRLKDIQLIVQANSPPALELLPILCGSVLAQLETINTKHKDHEGLARDFLHYASELERKSPGANIPVVERFFSHVYSQLLQKEKGRQKYGSLGSILTVAIYWRLTSFAKAEIDAGTTNFDGSYYAPFGTSRSSLRPLLQYCLPPYSHLKDAQEEKDEEGLMPQEMLVAALFAKGADPNQVIDDLTIWEGFLRQAKIIRDAHRGDEAGSILGDHSWIRTTQLFIENGAFASGQDPRHPPKWEEHGGAGRGSMYNVAPRDLADAVGDIFGRENGPIFAKALRDRDSLNGRFKRLFGM